MFEDLQPYLCTSEECGTLMFAHKRAWAEHEMQIHRREWHCRICRHGHFDCRSDLEWHTKMKHKDIANSQTLDTFLETCSRPIEVFPASTCDFCDWAAQLRAVPENANIDMDGEINVTAAQFLKHVARHIEQVALFSLPRNIFSDADSAVAGIGEEEWNGSSRALVCSPCIHPSHLPLSADRD